MLPRKVIVGPAKEPLSLEEAKRFLRITTDAEDDVVQTVRVQTGVTVAELVDQARHQ